MIQVTIKANNNLVYDIGIVNKGPADESDTDLRIYEWEVLAGDLRGQKGQTLHFRQDGAAILCSLVLDEVGDGLQQRQEAQAAEQQERSDA